MRKASPKAIIRRLRCQLPRLRRSISTRDLLLIGLGVVRSFPFIHSWAQAQERKTPGSPCTILPTSACQWLGRRFAPCRILRWGLAQEKFGVVMLMLEENSAVRPCARSSILLNTASTGAPTDSRLSVSSKKGSLILRQSQSQWSRIVSKRFPLCLRMIARRHCFMHS